MEQRRENVRSALDKSVEKYMSNNLDDLRPEYVFLTAKVVGQLNVKDSLIELRQNLLVRRRQLDSALNAGPVLLENKNGDVKKSIQNFEVGARSKMTEELNEINRIDHSIDSSLSQAPKDGIVYRVKHTHLLGKDTFTIYLRMAGDSVIGSYKPMKDIYKIRRDARENTGARQ